MRLLCVTAISFVTVIGCGDDDGDGSTFESGGSSGAGGTGGAGGLVTGGTGGSGATDGGGGVGGVGGTAGSCTTTYGQGQECMDCLQTSCCSQAAACENDADCAALVACVRQCPDPSDSQGACVQGCANPRQGALPAYNAVIVCMGTHCSGVCSFL